MKSRPTNIFFHCFSVNDPLSSTLRGQHLRELCHPPDRHNYVNLMKQSKKPYPFTTPPPYTWLGQVLICLVLILTVAGCHFPQPIPEDPIDPAQRMTEIAGILHPDRPNTPTPLLLPTQGVSGVTPPPNPVQELDGFLVYTVQQGDTLTALALRFEVEEAEIQSAAPLPDTGLLSIGSQIQLPDRLEGVLPYTNPIMPDSEVIYGPSVGVFDTAAYARAAGGFLGGYAELVRGETMNGPEIVQQVAIETSTNPRLLLAFLEYRSGWVLGHPPGAENNRYPIGYNATGAAGLYHELMITARLLAQGFYGWRDGSRLAINFKNGSQGRLSPGLNPGSAALMGLVAALHERQNWETQLYGQDSFLTFYENMFGDYWSRAATVEPYLLATDRQPELALPFTPGEAWSLTAGPHSTWQTGTPRGALDFAPITGEPPCAVSFRWVTAAAPGLVVRTGQGVVALDLDGDGDEGTGWVLVFLHIAEKGRVSVGTWVAQDAPIGHPSCEGGQSTGTHVHLARKFNGEWLGIDEPFPMMLSGWRAYAGKGRYEGYLQKGDSIVTSRPDGSSGSTIIRDD
jgi:LasA protease